MFRTNNGGARVRFATFSPDGKQVVAACGSDIYFFDADSGKELRKFQSLGNPKIEWRGKVCVVNFSPDGTKIAVATEDGIRRETPEGDVIIGGKENILWITDVETGRVLQKLEGHMLQVMYATFSSDGKKVVTASADGTTRIWTLE